MRTRRLAAVVVLALSFATGPGTAQELSPTVAAVVDFERLIRDSAAGQALRAQVEEKRSGFKAEVATQEETLRAEDQELLQQQTVLDANQFAEKRQKFQVKVAEVQRLVQSRKQTLDRAMDSGIDEIKKVTVAIVGEMAKAKGINLVLPLTQVLLVDADYDLTGPVMEELNRRLPTVTVTFTSE